MHMVFCMQKEYWNIPLFTSDINVADLSCARVMYEPDTTGNINPIAGTRQLLCILNKSLSTESPTELSERKPLTEMKNDTYTDLPFPTCPPYFGMHSLYVQTNSVLANLTLCNRVCSIHTKILTYPLHV